VIELGFRTAISREKICPDYFTNYRHSIKTCFGLQ